MSQTFDSELTTHESYSNDSKYPTQFRPFHFPRIPSPNATLNSNTQCGSALASEIDAYRRRIQTLLHFFDCIGQYWWDRLYPYKDEFIKRPSKSADEVRAYQTRLVVRLNKFTMRNVIPAAAAIAMMEAQATIKVLPANMLSPLSSELTNLDMPVSTDNSAVLLYKACNLARQLGDIEKLKQRLILAALTWVTSDGRDINLRMQRVALLARHSEPSLIEHFSGLRALLTHYYRPRVLVRKHTGKYGFTKPVPVTHTEPLTATKLTTTNEQILSVLGQICPKLYHEIMSQINSLSKTNDLLYSMNNLIWNNTISINDDNNVNENSNLLKGSTNLLNSNLSDLSQTSKIPILPSIVLNPLSIDTSQLEWLNYEINQKDFNLHLLNLEEPDNKPTINDEWFDIKSSIKLLKPNLDINSIKTSKSLIKPIEKRKLIRSNQAQGYTVTSTGQIIGSIPATTTAPSTLLQDSNLTLSTTNLTLNSFDFLKSINLKKTDYLNLEETNKKLEESTLGNLDLSLESYDDLSSSTTSIQTLAAHGEGTLTPIRNSISKTSEHSSNFDYEPNPDGKGEQLVKNTMQPKYTNKFSNSSKSLPNNDIKHTKIKAKMNEKKIHKSKSNQHYLNLNKKNRLNRATNNQRVYK